MTDENTSENDKSSGNNKVAETINAVTGLTQSVPVYQDLIQPAAQELGKGLAVIAQSVNAALLPLRLMVWKIEDIEKRFIPKVAEKLKNTKPEDIITPKPNIAVPAIEALRYTADDESLSDLFAGLLASAMDKNKADKAHPSFVEIIKQITADEAEIINRFNNGIPIALIDIKYKKVNQIGEFLIYENISNLESECKINNPSLIGSYINNLCRLGLVEIPSEYYMIHDDLYKRIESSPLVQGMVIQINRMVDVEVVIRRKILRVTSFGRLFAKACTSQ
ncbi:DUF4393 domain-containing protein [Pectobacterium punjabense]|uniref:DUF4393 domain-containing protein n=1 Tax=Pectobacterium punjabense TaxID=2108399 RepID=UPI003D9AF251